MSNSFHNIPVSSQSGQTNNIYTESSNKPSNYDNLDSIISQSKNIDQDPNLTISDSSHEALSDIDTNLKLIQQSDFEQPTDLLKKPGIKKNKSENDYKQGRWTNDEHFRFIEAMLLYGNNWKKVQRHIGTRSPTQARSHAQKFFIRIKKRIFKDKDGPFNSERILSQVKHFVKQEILDKIVNNEDMKKFINLYENKDKLSKVILIMLENFSKEKGSKKNIEIDNGMDFDFNIRDDDFSTWEKHTAHLGSTHKSIHKLPSRKSSLKRNEIFSIEKTISRKISEETPIVNPNYNIVPQPNNISQQNTAVYNNQVINPTGNSYINIFTINLCKDKNNINGGPLFEDNQLDGNFDYNLSNKTATNNFLNFINDQKGFKSVNSSIIKPKKDELVTSYKGKGNLGFGLGNDIFSEGFIENNRNNLNMRFDDVNEDFFFVDSKGSNKEKNDSNLFDMDHFFNPK